MSKENLSDSLEQLCGDVADAHTVDWDEVQTSMGQEVEPALLDNLRIISAIARAHHRFGLTTEVLNLPFPSWSHLQILSPLGEGAYGETFLAWDDTLQREVCLKLFKADAEGGLAPTEHSALLTEARHLAKIRAPHVVRVQGAATDHGRVGFWMEYIKGQTLQQRIQAGDSFSFEEIARIGHQLSLALDAVHSAGVVHRDVKAANVIQEATGDVFLADFGAGLLLGPDATHQRDAPTGTPLYMAPEVLERGICSPRSDIYSLGVLLFYLLTRRFPIEAASTPSLLEKHRRGERSTLEDHGAKCPPELSELIEDCLEPDPLKRTSDARGLAERFRKIVEPERTTPRLLLVAAVALLVVLGSLALWAQLGVTHGPRQQFGEITRLTFSGQADIPRFSPDGKRLAYLDGRTAWVTGSRGDDPRPLKIGSLDLFVPWTWSADNSRLVGLAFGPESDGSYVAELDPVTGSSEMLRRNAVFPALSPDGSRLAFASREGDYTVWVRDLATGHERQLVSLFATGEAAYKPLWSPDGNHIAYMRWRGLYHELWLVNSDGTEDHLIDTSPTRVLGFYDFFPDGKSIAVGGETFGMWSIWKVPLDGSAPVQLTESTDRESFHVTVAPDGEHLAFHQGLDSSWIALMDTHTGAIRRLTSMEIANREPSFLPGDDELVFQVLENGRWQIWKGAATGDAPPTPMLRIDGKSASQPRADDSGGMYYLRGETGRAVPFGKILWNQSLWHHTASGEDREAEFAIGDHITGLAYGGVRNNAVLYGAPNGSSMGVFFCHRGEKPLLVIPGVAERPVYSFDWGRDTGAVLAIQEVATSTGSVYQLNRVTVGTGESSVVLQPADLPPAEGASATLLLEVASSPTSPEAALLAEYPGFQALLIIDLRDDSVRYVGPIELAEGEHPERLAWSHDGQTISFNVHRERSDIYLWTAKAE